MTDASRAEPPPPDLPQATPDMPDMSPADFKSWRKSLGLSQKQAAEALGLKRRVVQYYEKGERDGDKVDIPKSVRLACWALAQGVADYRGPLKGVRGGLPEPKKTPQPPAEHPAG